MLGTGPHHPLLLCPSGDRLPTRQGNWQDLPQAFIKEWLRKYLCRGRKILFSRRCCGSRDIADDCGMPLNDGRMDQQWVAAPRARVEVRA